MFKVRFLGRFLGLGFCLCAALVAFTVMVFAVPTGSVPSLPGTGPSTGTTTTAARSTTTTSRSTTTTARSTTTTPGATTTAAGATTTTAPGSTTTAAGATTTTAPGSTTTIASDSCDTQNEAGDPFPDGKITGTEVDCVEAAAAVITEGEKCVNLGSGVLKSSTSTTDKACGTSSSSDNLIMQIIRSAILFLVAGIGVVMTGVLAVAGLQYMTARGNPQAVSAAKMKIFNVVVGFILYIMTTAIMNFLVPGGLFTK